MPGVGIFSEFEGFFGRVFYCPWHFVQSEGGGCILIFDFFAGQPIWGHVFFGKVNYCNTTSSVALAPCLSIHCLVLLPRKSFPGQPGGCHPASGEVVIMGRTV